MDLIAILQKMGAIISVQTDRVITIEGVDPARRLQPPGHPRPDRGGVVGLRRAGHERRHLRARGPAAADDAVPQRVPADRRRLRRRRRGHPVLAPGRRPARHRPRDRRAPGLHDRLAAAAGRGADPDHRAVDRARDGLREPARLHRRAARLRRADPDLPRVPGRVTLPVRPGQLPALGGHLRPEPAAGRRDHRARPARRLQLPDRRPGRARGARPCTASTSSTAATSGSRRSSTPSAPPTSSAARVYPVRLRAHVGRGSGCAGRPIKPHPSRRRATAPSHPKGEVRTVSGCPRRGRCRRPTPGWPPGRRGRARR